MQTLLNYTNIEEPPLTNSIDHLINIDWDFSRQQNGDGIFNLHPYPAKFISYIPNQLLKTIPLTPNSLIFDPFCGCGTTLIAAQNLGHQSIGVDINPIACLISKVATQDCPSVFLESAESCIKKAKMNEGKFPIPLIPNIDHWFKKSVQHALNGLIHEINEYEEESLRNALNLALSSIIVRVSNQDSDTRYAAVNKSVSNTDVYSIFYRTCQKYKKILSMSSKNKPKATILNKNIFELSPNIFTQKIDLVICSPPYPAAYEYWLYHKYRMWWLGYDPLSVKENEIGARSHFFKKNNHTAEDFEKQMHDVFKLLKKICKEKSYACFVLGDSKIHGQIVDNTKLLISAANHFDCSVCAIIPRNVNVHRKSFNLVNSRIKNENVVILQM